MKTKKYFIGIIGILMLMMFIGCSTGKENINKDSVVKSPIIENLEIEINNKKIELVNSENGIDISKDLLKQIGGNVESELNGVWTEKQLEVLAGFENKEESGRLVIKNLGNKKVKINGMKIGDMREKLKKKWEDEKWKTMRIGNIDIIVYNSLCEIECKFEDDKLAEIIYKYNPVEGLLSTNLEDLDENSDWENLDEDIKKEKKKLIYPTKFDFSKEEEQEYAAVINQYEEKYGKLQIVNDQPRGVCFLKFLDLKNDNSIQLMVGYSSKEEVVDGKMYMDYSFDIWDYEDGKAVKVDSGECFHQDGDYKLFLILEQEGQKYIVSSENLPECERDQKYHGYKNGKFGIARYEKKDGIYYAINGEEILQEDYYDRLWISKKDSQDEFRLNDYGIECKNELWKGIYFVKEVLHMKND